LQNAAVRHAQRGSERIEALGPAHLAFVEFQAVLGHGSLEALAHAHRCVVRQMPYRL
jgi:hypothetical protein